jgi:hypothetical protein
MGRRMLRRFCAHRKVVGAGVLCLLTVAALGALAPAALGDSEHERAEAAEHPLEQDEAEEHERELPTAQAQHRFNPISSPETNQLAVETIARSFTADVAPCSVGTGLAFDGVDLLISCWSTNTIEVVSREDGAFVARHEISGISGIGAIAWDAANRQLWACDAANQFVSTIDLTNDTAQSRFASQGCIDGLSFDASDDTLWTSADVASSVQHYKPNGDLIDSFELNGTLGGCGNSGIAAGATMLFLANDGCSEVYQVPKDHLGVTGDEGQTTLVGGYPARLEDLECDDQTFDDKTVIWSKDAYDAVINAFDVGSVDCGVGGYRDADGDGLADTTEQTPELQAMGADPRHKDLFVELDYYAEHGHKVGPWTVGGWSRQPSPDVVNKVTQAYNVMGVRNPDGVNGIHLHLDGGPDTIMNPATGEKWGSRSRSNAIYGASSPTDWANATFWSNLDDLRPANVDADRRATFHYLVLVDHLDSCFFCLDGKTTGISRGIPGHDLLVAAGDVSGLEESVTIAHELGHNIGLGHGGAPNAQHPISQHIGHKANYLSIMNYFYLSTGLQADVDGKPVGAFISFSPQALGTLDTEDLDEQAGLDPDPFGHFFFKYRCPGGGERRVDAWDAVDWNCKDGVANGSRNARLQDAVSAEALAKDPALGRYVYGSNDYAPNAMRFWGVGEAWDNAAKAMIERDQPGTEEPTIEELRDDGDFYAGGTLLTDPPQEVSVAASSGTLSVPIAVSNPLEAPVTADASVVEGAGVATLQESGPVVVAGGSAEVRHLLVDTAKLTAGADTVLRVTFSVADAGVVAEAQVTVHALGAGAALTCQQAADVVADPTATPAQVAAAQAVLAGCGRSGGGGSGGGGSGGGGSGSGPSATPGGSGNPTAGVDRRSMLVGLRALLRQPRDPSRRRLLRAGGFRTAFVAPVPGRLELRWRTTAGPRASAAGRRILVAAGRMRFAAAGRQVVEVRLTAAGRRVLRARRRVAISATATFRPVGGDALHASRSLGIS